MSCKTEIATSADMEQKPPRNDGNMMSNIEKIIIAVLTITALVSAIFAYNIKSSKDATEAVPLREAKNIEAAKDMIEKKIIIDINTADKDELTKIPGIGPYLAQNIIDYRREYGIFTSLGDIIKVKGIGPKKYEKMKGYIKIDG